VNFVFYTQKGPSTTARRTRGAATTTARARAPRSFSVGLQVLAACVGGGMYCLEDGGCGRDAVEMIRDIVRLLLFVSVVVLDIVVEQKVVVQMTDSN